jgi:MATE family multidrug resistance protein
MHNPAPPRQTLWRQEAGHLGRSGVTLAFNQLLQIAIPFVTTSMTGRLGVDELACGSLVGSIGLLLFITTIGVLQGVVPLAGAGIGAGDDAAAAGAIRGCLVIAAVMGIAATLIMAAVPWCLAHSGQDPALVALAQRFIVALLPGYFPSILGLAARFSLIAANDLKWLNPIIISGIAFNLACNLLFAGSGPEGLTVIGTVITLTSWLMLGLLALAMWRSKRVPNGVLDLKAGLAVRNVLALGIPVGAIFFTETLLFTGSSLLMGYFGKVALAAHGIVLLWLNIALMMPIGLSSAAMARVAFLLGQRDLVALKHAVVVSLVVGSAVSIVIGALLVANSDSLVRLAMWSRSGGGEAEAVIETARGFFIFCAITQLMSGLVIVMASILRGLRDANAVLWLVMLGYWGVGLGGAGLFGFALGLGGTGIWLGIALAFVFAVVLLATRFSQAFARFRQAGPQGGIV